MKSQQGSLLLEALITLAILSIGLLGIGMLQARALNVGSSTYYRSVASDIAADLADRITANASPFRGTDTTGIYTAPDYSTITCTATTTDAPSCGTSLAGLDMTAFHQAVRQLPNAEGTVTKPAGAPYTITVKWNDKLGGGASTDANNIFTTRFAAP